jgi:methyl-accepting chemotaxis protein PixJ
MTQSPSDPQSRNGVKLSLPGSTEDLEQGLSSGSQLQISPRAEDETSSKVQQQQDEDSDAAQPDLCRQIVRHRRAHRGWNLTTKSTLSAIAVSTVPLLILAGILYGQPPKSEPSLMSAEEVKQGQQNLGLGAGVMAIAAGVTAVLLARRTTRPVVKLANASSRLVNRLRQEDLAVSDRVAGRDELTALEANLQILSQQLPGLLLKQEAEAEWLKVLMEITRKLRQARSKEDVLRIAATEVRQRFKTERVAVFQFQSNDTGVFIEESLAQGWPKLLWSTVQDPCFSDGYIEKYREGRVRAIDDIYEANLGACHIGLLERFGVRANLVAPILREGELFGLLIAHQCSGSRFWQSAEVDLFAQIAAQVGFTLDHTKLLEEVDQRATRSQLFIEISRRIRASLNAEDVLKIAVSEVRKAMNADRVVVYSFDEQWFGTVTAEAVLPGYPKALWANIKDPCFAEGYVDKYQAGRVEATDNIYDAGLTECHLKQLEPFQVKANLVAPILKEDRLFGLLIAHQCSGPRQWQPSEIDWFVQIATQIGFALDHAHLLEQVNIENVQSRVLADITRQIRASLIEDDVLKTTVTETRRAFQADRVIVYSFDEAWYGTVVAEAVLPGYPKALRAKIKDPCFAEGYVDQYREGRVQAVSNIETAGLTRCHLRQLEPYAVRANLVAPILKEDKLFGLLIAHQCSGPRQWQPSEIELFTQIAIQVGFALDHARLLDHVEQAYQSAEAATAGQRHQREVLLQEVQGWLRQNEPAVKEIADSMLRQMESITTIYQHLKTFTAEHREALTLLSQQEAQGQQTHQAVQKSHAIAEALQQSLLVAQGDLSSATQQVEQLHSPAQKLSESIQFIHQITSQMKLQAMNAALEAARMGGAAQEFASVGDRVLDLARQLENRTEELTTLADLFQSQLLGAVSTLQQEAQTVQLGVQLGDQAEQTLAQSLESLTQLQNWLQTLIQSAQRQSESSDTANQMILDVASWANQASEQAISVAKTLDRLVLLSHEELAP